MLWWTFKIHFPEISSMWNFIYICVLKQMCSCMVNILIRAIMAGSQSIFRCHSNYIITTAVAINCCTEKYIRWIFQTFIPFL